MGSRPVSRTAHFVLHLLPRQSMVVDGADGAWQGQARKLSTGEGAEPDVLVDDLVTDLPGTGQLAWRLGLVLPKKQAKRSVTRSLIRHQAREALRRHAPAVLAQGQHGDEVDGWVLRLRAPFDRTQFPSAASDALKAVVRQELDELWSRLDKDSSARPSGKPRGAA